MCFDHIHSSQNVLQISFPFDTPNFMLFVSPSNLCCPDNFGCRAFSEAQSTYWELCSQRKLTIPQLTVARCSWLRVVSHIQLPSPPGVGLNMSCAYCHNCCEFMCATALGCPGDISIFIHCFWLFYRLGSLSFYHLCIYTAR